VIDVPALFTRIPPALFGPLGGNHATLHWAMLAVYYHYEFEREPFFLLRSVVVDTAEELVRESSIWQERRQELLGPPEGAADAVEAGDEAALLRAAARRVVGRLESAGWFHFEYRSGIGEVLNFYPYAARLLDTLVRVARDEQPLFQGFAHSIASLLKPEVFAARPGVSLSEAKRHTLDLVRELKILNRNIYASTQRLLDEAATAAGVLDESLERYRRAVMANYHRLKTVDNLYKWRGEIVHRLDSIERDARALDAAARWYAEQAGLDNATAAARVAQDLGLLRMQFETLPTVTDDIDTRNARFSGVALRKLMYLLRQDTRTEGQLQLLVDALAGDRAPDFVFDVYRCELLTDSFLYTAPRRRPRPAAQPLALRPPADTADLRRQVAPRLRRPFARPRVEAFVDDVLAGRPSAPLSDAGPDTDEEYVRLIYTVAYGLDGGSPFRFEREPGTSEDRVERRGVYGFPRGALVRRLRRR
jgi:Wadjet protein JetA